jgi:sugar phosphate isomerase/epimerase
MDLNHTELVEARTMLRDNGISVSAIGSPIGKVKLDLPFQEHLEKFKHAIELADFFSAPYIRLFSYYAPDGQQIDNFRDEVLKRMAIQAEMVKGTGIILVHENESHIYGYSAANCADIMHSVNSDKLRLVYDPANFVWGSQITDNMDSCWPLVAPYVVHVHIKDWKSGSIGIGSIPGQGDGQIKKLLQTLADTGYKGFITMEPHLESGGQFGGRSGPELFKQAILATRRLCDEVGLGYR